MLYIIISFATVLAACWFCLLGRAAPEDWIIIAYNKVLDNMEAIEKLRRKEAVRQGKLAGSSGIASVGVRLLYGGSHEKEIARLTRENKMLQEGDLRKIGVLEAPGCVMLRKFKAISRSGIRKTIFTSCVELYGKKHAENKTQHILAKLLSYPVIGIAGVAMISSVCIAFGNLPAGYGILGIGSALILVLVYSLYDELRDKVRKRREAIARQFPNVVSKLALLVTSGMIMDRAWRETSRSRDEELYLEMRKTTEELDNLVSPEVAYSGFINRCSTKETARLASAIMQNLSKGNAEIGRLLGDMAREAWQERRHTAKRDAEKANSRLMIPTVMLFIAILIMLMVPIAMNFSGF